MKANDISQKERYRWAQEGPRTLFLGPAISLFLTERRLPIPEQEAVALIKEGEVRPVILRLQMLKVK